MRFESRLCVLYVEDSPTTTFHKANKFANMEYGMKNQTKPTTTNSQVPNIHQTPLQKSPQENTKGKQGIEGLPLHQPTIHQPNKSFDKIHPKRGQGFLETWLNMFFSCTFFLPHNAGVMIGFLLCTLHHIRALTKTGGRNTRVGKQSCPNLILFSTLPYTKADWNADLEC